MTVAPARRAVVAGGGLALAPAVVLSAVLLVVGAGTGAPPPSGDCGAAGTGGVVSGTALDAEQQGSARTIVEVTARRGLSAYAATVAVTAAYTESRLHNATVPTDHDSIGLFQQRISIYSAAVAADPMRATGAFLDRLVQLPVWASTPEGEDAQAVQRSAFPGRYQPNAGLARQLVGEFWPAAAAESAHGTGPLPAAAAVCPAAGPVPVPTGRAGSNVAGTTSIPAGLVITGSPVGGVVVRYALAQLGKPYAWGAAGPGSFDCSGLTMAAWAAAGVALPHLAAAQAAAGAPEPLSLIAAAGGDLVLIPGADGTAARPGHVGLVAGYVPTRAGRRLYLIQAPMTGVPVELTDTTSWAGQIVAVRHIR